MNREEYPRVSDIISPWRDAIFGQNPPEKVAEAIAKAASRGTDIHAYCIAYLREDFIPSLTPEHDAYFQCFLHWNEKIRNADLLLSEERLYDDELMFSGQMDFIIHHDNKNILVDIKTGCKYSPLWPIQLAAYTSLCTKNNIPIDEAHILHIGANKKWTDEYKNEQIITPKKPKLYVYNLTELEYYFREYFRPCIRWHYLVNPPKKEEANVD